jgi:hypothetical protein
MTLFSRQPLNYRRFFDVPCGGVIQVYLGHYHCGICGYDNDEVKFQTIQASDAYTEDGKRRWWNYIGKPSGVCECTSARPGVWLEDDNLPENAVMAERQ